MKKYTRKYKKHLHTKKKSNKYRKSRKINRFKKIYVGGGKKELEEELKIINQNIQELEDNNKQLFDWIKVARDSINTAQKAIDSGKISATKIAELQDSIQKNTIFIEGGRSQLTENYANLKLNKKNKEEKISEILAFEEQYKSTQRQKAEEESERATAELLAEEGGVPRPISRKEMKKQERIAREKDRLFYDNFEEMGPEDDDLSPWTQEKYSECVGASCKAVRSIKQPAKEQIKPLTAFSQRITFDFEPDEDLGWNYENPHYLNRRYL